MGPVPVRYEGLYEYLADNRKITVKNIVYSDDVVGEQFHAVSDNPFKEEPFSEQELIILKKVADYFREVSTSQIIDYSHKEKAWKENENGNKLIDYKYSFDLELQFR